MEGRERWPSPYPGRLLNVPRRLTGPLSHMVKAIKAIGRWRCAAWQFKTRFADVGSRSACCTYTERDGYSFVSVAQRLYLSIGYYTIQKSRLPNGDWRYRDTCHRFQGSLPPHEHIVPRRAFSQAPCVWPHIVHRPRSRSNVTSISDIVTRDTHNWQPLWPSAHRRAIYCLTY